MNRLLSIAGAVALASVILSSCATKRTVLSERRGTTKFGDDDSDEIRKKFTDHGYSIDESGTINADNKNLYSNRDSKAGNKVFGGRKDARIQNRNASKKEFKTPEYLKRSQYNGTIKTPYESSMVAEDGNNRASETGRSFAKKEAGFIQKMNPFASKRFRGSNDTFKTTANYTGTKALRNSPRADGVQRTSGFLGDAEMTVDDVKRMVNPNAYANAKGL